MENNQIFDSLLSDYQVRKSKKQKLRFISFIHEKCIDLGMTCRVEEKRGLVKNRNIVVGDVEKARVIFTAHYDTCAWMPVPNFITPKNIFFFVLYQFLLFGAIAFICLGIAFLATLFISKEFLLPIYNILFFVVLLQMLVGFPNKHTANDNTSGVATLLSLMQNIPTAERDKVAFVFFDNEELGLIGSSMFKKLHKKIIANKLLINFDCVSDGDHFLFVSRKRASNSEEFPLLKSIIEEEAPLFNKNSEFSNALRAFFPSDQIIYSKSIGVVALKKSSVLGLYLDRLHTSKDTRFDKNNLDFLTSSFTKFILQI